MIAKLRQFLDRETLENLAMFVVAILWIALT
jgi:hypothetical protein